MRVRCIDSRGASFITQGKIYKIIRREPHFVYIINDRGVNDGSYSAHRFETVIDDSLPNGWKYCSMCETITSNPIGLCCTCKDL